MQHPVLYSRETHNDRSDSRQFCWRVTGDTTSPTAGPNHRGIDNVTTQPPTATQPKIAPAPPKVGVRLAFLLMPLIAVMLAIIGSKNPLLAIAMALAVPAAYSLVAWPEVATLATVFILYTNSADIAVTFHKVPYILAASFVLLLTIPLTYYLIVRREPLVVTSALPWVVLYAVVLAAGATMSKFPDEAFKEVVKFVAEGLGIYVLVTNAVRTPSTLRRVCWTLLAAGAVMAGIPVLQQITGNYDNNFGGFGQISDAMFSYEDADVQSLVRQPRLSGPIGEANRYAQLLLMLIPIGLFASVAEKKKPLRWFGLGITVLMLTGMSMSFSRGAAVATGVLVLIMVWMKYISRKQFIIVCLGIAMLLVAVPQYANRIARLGGLWALVSPPESAQDIKPNKASRGRKIEALAAIRIFMDYPVLGVGPGMYNNYYIEYSAKVGDVAQRNTREAHNLYLGIGAESGFLGLGCFMMALLVTLRDLARVRRRSLGDGTPHALIATGFLLAVVSYMVTGMTLHLSFGRFFWLIMALSGSAAVILNRSAATPPRFKEVA